MQIARLILDWPLQLLQGRFNGAALRVAQHHHQAGAELFGGELDAADLGWGDDVAGDADDEQIAEALIEDDFDRYPGVGTAENGGEWFLCSQPTPIGAPDR